MNSTPDPTLKNLAETSLAKCIVRISRVSAGTWQLLGVDVSSGTIGDAVKRHDFKDPAIAVYFNRQGTFPLAAMMMFAPSQMECISKCFTGHSFPRGKTTTIAEAVMLTELGNIVLNALTNGLLNALNKGSLPVGPLFVEGDERRVTAEIGKDMNLKQVFRIITATLELKSDKSAARSEVLALLPEELAMELELRQPAAES